MPSSWPIARVRTRVRHNSGGSVLEPFTLLSALAATTHSIGLIGTASTTSPSLTTSRDRCRRWITFRGAVPAGTW